MDGNLSGQRVTYEPCTACQDSSRVSDNTPVINWYLVNGFKEISIFVPIALLHLPLRINAAGIASRIGGYGFRIPAGVIYFLQILPSGYGIHPASFSMGSGVTYRG